MRLPHDRRRGPIEFNMTPMIDVVFLLIIFFLVSSHLAKQETQLEMPLPAAAQGTEPTSSDAPRVTLNLLADGQIHLAGRAVSASQLADRFQALRQESGKDVEIRIRGHRDVPYEHVEPILLACAKSGIWNVTFAVYQAEPR